MSLSLGSNPDLTTMDQKSSLWQQRILDAMRVRVDETIQHPLVIPTRAGGWWHQYVCPKHELPLIFEALSPDLHHCPLGCSHQGERFDAAFRVFAHRHYAALSRDAAVLYKATSATQYLDASLEILSHYADLYEQFDGGSDSDPWMLTGKAFHQALTEAIWVVPLTQAFEILHPDLTDEQSELIEKNLLRPVAKTLTKAHEKLIAQPKKLKSNYNAWLIAALGCLGFALNEEDRIQRTIDGPGGFKAHLTAALMPDSFEHEGSPYYHNFVSWAYTLLAEAARNHDIDLYTIQGDHGQSIQQMWHVLPSLAWPDGRIPLLHDGNHWQNSSYDAEICEVVEIALARTGDPRFAWLLDRAYLRCGTERDTWAALLFADMDITNSPRPEMKSTTLKDVGLAVLRDATNPDGLSALMRFGPYGAGHTHRDCLALLLFPCSLDAGNPPYGVDTRRSWYQQSAAHNVVMVDGQSQTKSSGQLLSWVSEPGRCAAKATADEIYPGVKVSRRVSLEAGQINDHTSLIAESKRTFDWLFHTDVAPTISDIQLFPAQGSLFPEGAGSFIQLVSQGRCADNLQTVFEQSGQQYRLTLSSSNPMKIFLARSPQRGGINMDKRYTLIARVQGQQTDFFANFEII